MRGWTIRSERARLARVFNSRGWTPWPATCCRSSAGPEPPVPLARAGPEGFRAASAVTCSPATRRWAIRLPLDSLHYLGRRSTGIHTGADRPVRAARRPPPAAAPTACGPASGTGLCAAHGTGRLRERYSVALQARTDRPYAGRLSAPGRSRALDHPHRAAWKHDQQIPDRLDHPHRGCAAQGAPAGCCTSSCRRRGAPGGLRGAGIAAVEATCHGAGRAPSSSKATSRRATRA